MGSDLTGRTDGQTDGRGDVLRRLQTECCETGFVSPQQSGRARVSLGNRLPQEVLFAKPPVGRQGKAMQLKSPGKLPGRWGC